MKIFNHLNRMTYFSAQTVLCIYNKKNMNNQKLFITYVCRMRDTVYHTVKKNEKRMNVFLVWVKPTRF